jgi:putative sterol carrier protein
MTTDGEQRTANGEQPPLVSVLPSLFTPEGIARWQAHLNGSAVFAEAAAGWVGTLVLRVLEIEPPCRTFVRVDDGRCSEARLADADDLESADFVLSATTTTWLALIAARTTPTMAAMTGRLHLEKGDLFALIPHAKAAAELLAAAAD